MKTEQIRQWTPGTIFEFSVGDRTTNLVVEANDGENLTAIVGGAQGLQEAKDGNYTGKRMTFHLVGLDDHPQISQ